MRNEIRMLKAQAQAELQRLEAQSSAKDVAALGFIVAVVGFTVVLLIAIL